MTLTWTLEASDIKRVIVGKKSPSDGKPRYYHKPHIALLSHLLGRSAEEEFPLKGTSPAGRRWNICMWVTSALLGAAIVTMIASGAGHRASLLPSIIVLAGTALILGAVGLKQGALTLWFVGYVLTVVVAAALWVCTCLGVGEWIVDTRLLTALVLAAYMFIYLLFRNMNYETMHGSTFKNIVESLAKGFVWALHALLGRDACALLFPEKDPRGEKKGGPHASSFEEEELAQTSS